MLLNCFRSGPVKDSFEYYKMATEMNNAKGFAKLKKELKWAGRKKRSKIRIGSVVKLMEHI